MKEVRILFVDDDEGSKKVSKTLIEHWFSMLGRAASVETASTPSEAIEKMKRDHFNLVISDLNLKDSTRTGVQVLLEAKIWISGVKTMLISGNFGQESMEERLGGDVREVAKKEGIDLLLGKPFVIKELGEAIESLGVFAEE